MPAGVPGPFSAADLVECLEPVFRSHGGGRTNVDWLVASWEIRSFHMQTPLRPLWPRCGSDPADPMHSSPSPQESSFCPCGRGGGRGALSSHLLGAPSRSSPEAGVESLWNAFQEHNSYIVFHLDIYKSAEINGVFTVQQQMWLSALWINISTSCFARIYWNIFLVETVC